MLNRSLVVVALASLAACGDSVSSSSPDSGRDAVARDLSRARPVEDGLPSDRDGGGVLGEVAVGEVAALDLPAPIDASVPIDSAVPDASIRLDGPEARVALEAGSRDIRPMDVFGDVAVVACTEQVFPDAGMVNELSFSPDGQLIGGNTFHSLSQLRLSDGAPVGVPSPPSCPAPVHGLGYFPDGQTVALQYCGGTLVVYKTGTIAYSLGITQKYVISPDGNLIATGGAAPSPDGVHVAFNVSLWNAADGTLKTSLLTKLGYISELAFSTDGTRLAVASREGVLDVWHVATGALLKSIPTTSTVTDLAFLPGNLLATLNDQHVLELWELVTYTRGVSTAVDAKTTEIAASPNGEFLLVAGSTLAAYWAERLSLAYVLDTEPVSAVAVAPDGVRVAGTKADGALRIYCLP